METNVLFITNSQLGGPSVDLGKILMKSFLATFIDKNNFTHVILVNSGVELACAQANTIDDLQEMAQKSNVLLCQTCLNYYGLEDKVKVGQKSNMQEIASILTASSKVVTI